MDFFLRKFFESDSKRRLQTAIVFSVLFLIAKIFFPEPGNILVSLITEILVLTAFFSWALFLYEFVHNQASSPVGILVNSMILGALVYFLLTVSPEYLSTNDNVITSLLVYLFVFIILVSTAYIFDVLRELFFAHQKSVPTLYFNTMMILFILASVVAGIWDSDWEYDFITDSLTGIAIVVAVINSIRVAWIAFIAKKQKRILLLLSIIFMVVFGSTFGFTQTQDANFVALLSPALNKFIGLIFLYATVYFIVVFFTALFHLPTAEAIDRKTQELTSLMDLNKLITRVLDFDELVNTITEMTKDVCNCQSAWLVTNFNDTLEINSVNNINKEDAEKISVNLFNSDLVNPKELTELNTLEKYDFFRSSKFQSVIIAPLNIHGKNIGYLFTAKQMSMGFDEEDKKAISAFADFAAVAIENSKLIEQSIEKERMEKELDLAREIQQKILPKGKPDIPNVDVSASFIPAFEVGGDYYDFFRLDDEHYGFVIADVSGKGIQSAFIMSEVKGIFESLSKIDFSPAEILIRANEILKKSLDRKSFVTATFGILNTKNGKFKFSRAGHAPVLHKRKDTLQSYVPRGIGLGISPSKEFARTLEEMEVQLGNGDLIILFTDGVNEAMNSANEEFGYDRLEAIVKNSGELSPDALSRKIIKELSVFSKENPQHDDITLVIFKWNFINKLNGDN